MNNEYIEQRNEGYYLAGSRISLASIVASFNRGESPDAIRQDFPSLKSAQVYGAIAFYLDRQTELDLSLAASKREFESHAVALQDANSALFERLSNASSTIGNPTS